MNAMMKWTATHLVVVALVLMTVQRPAKATPPSRVTLLRVPQDGIQPQVCVDRKGVVHMIYFRGEAMHGNLYYVWSQDAGKTFSQPIQVNSRPGSAIAIGNIRGAHLAIGKSDRVHVAWNGSDQAEPQGPEPMLYTRMNDAGTAFESERSVTHFAYGVDGGGSVAADRSGNVYVVWHAPLPGGKDEASRRVWVTHSVDEGMTFDREKVAYEQAIGVCACCGLRAFADLEGTLYVLYRSATEIVHRDMYLLVSKNRGNSFQGTNIHPWNVGYCVMSSEAFSESASGVLAAWETEMQVYYAHIDPVTEKMAPPIAAPGARGARKHPAVAASAQGETLLVWTEGMGWKKGGSLAWQIFDKAGRPEGEKGQASGVPTWSLVATFARPDGGFTIVY